MLYKLFLFFCDRTFYAESHFLVCHSPCEFLLQLIELLSIRAPTPEKKLNLLKEIAVEHDLDWDPAASESEFLKKHEDLLVSVMLY